MLKNNKKGLLPLLGLLLSPVTLIIMGVLLLLIILATFGFAFFLTANIFTLIGGMLVIIGAIGLLKGFAVNVGFILIFTGIGLILLPMLSEKIAGVTLATLMP